MVIVHVKINNVVINIWKHFPFSSICRLLSGKEDGVSNTGKYRVSSDTLIVTSSACVSNNEQFVQQHEHQSSSQQHQSNGRADDSEMISSDVDCKQVISLKYL